MANGKQITNADIYDRLDRLRIEVTKRIDDTSKEHKSELGDLRRQFETLEAGRLTRAEGNINSLGLDLQKAINTINSKIDGVSASGGTLSAKATIVGSIILVILTAFASALFYRLLVGGTK
jgi:hypothetical protein